MKWGAPLGLCVTTNLIRGCRPTEGLVVHQLGNAGLVSTHCTVSLLGSQPNGPEFGILRIKHQQLLAAGSWHTKSRARLFCEQTYSANQVAPSSFGYQQATQTWEYCLLDIMVLYKWKQILNASLKVRMIWICKFDNCSQINSKSGIWSDTTDQLFTLVFIIITQAQSIPLHPSVAILSPFIQMNKQKILFKCNAGTNVVYVQGAAERIHPCPEAILSTSRAWKQPIIPGTLRKVESSDTFS